MFYLQDENIHPKVLKISWSLSNIINNGRWVCTATFLTNIAAAKMLYKMKKTPKRCNVGGFIIYA